jgi:uncharacterized membrane protein
MGGEGSLELDETAVIVKNKEGKLRVTQDVNVVSKDKHLGHVAGLVAAAVTGTMPFILAGTVAGTLIGRLTDHGITNKFIKNIGKELKNGTSVLVLVGRSDSARRGAMIERLKQFDPRILESDLPDEIEQEINRKLQASSGSIGKTATDGGVQA